MKWREKEEAFTVVVKEEPLVVVQGRSVGPQGCTMETQWYTISTFESFLNQSCAVVDSELLFSNSL